MPLKILSSVPINTINYHIQAVKLMTWRDGFPAVPLLTIGVTFAQGRELTAEILNNNPYEILLRLTGERGDFLTHQEALHLGGCCDEFMRLSGSEGSSFLRVEARSYKLDGARIFVEHPHGDPNLLVIRSLGRLQQERLTYDMETLQPRFAPVP